MLGMHRSGTSAATRLVSSLGPALCVEADLLTHPGANPKGHFESISMVDLNDRLLAEMGRAWWCPPPNGSRHRNALARVATPPAEMRRLFYEVHVKRPWVWKDPRTCVTLPLWREALAEPVAIALVRSPVDVARSLHSRNRLSPQLGVAIWERQNRILLEAAAGMRLLVTR